MSHLPLRYDLKPVPKHQVENGINKLLPVNCDIDDDLPSVDFCAEISTNCKRKSMDKQILEKQNKKSRFDELMEDIKSSVTSPQIVNKECNSLAMYELDAGEESESTCSDVEPEYRVHVSGKNKKTKYSYK